MQRGGLIDESRVPCHVNPSCYGMRRMSTSVPGWRLCCLLPDPTGYHVVSPTSGTDELSPPSRNSDVSCRSSDVTGCVRYSRFEMLNRGVWDDRPMGRLDHVTGLDGRGCLYRRARRPSDRPS
jgi:hypothetical protein